MSVVKEGIAQNLIEEYRELSPDKKYNPKVFHQVFDDSPVSYWEFDGTAVRKYLKKLQKEGTKNINLYFIRNPIEVYKCAGLIKLQNVNSQTLKLFSAKNHFEFNKNLNKVFGDNAYPVFREVFVAFLKGKKKFQSDVLLKSLEGKELSIFITFTLVDEKRTAGQKLLFRLQILPN